MNAVQLKQFLHFSVPLKRPVLITGRPGVGKTHVVEQVKDELGMKYILRHPVIDDPTNYKGLGFAVSNTKADFLHFGSMSEIMEADEPTLCFFDDIGPAPAAVQAALMQLLWAREIDGKKVSPHVAFLGATNRREDRSGVGGILEAVKGRFSIVPFEVEVEAWVQWALAQAFMPVELIAACRFFPEWLTTWSPTSAIENSPNPRNIAEVGFYMSHGIPEGLEYDVYRSRLGEAAATKLHAFINLYSKLPSVEEIILNPDGAKLPTDPGSQYAISLVLAKRSNDQNFGPIVTYVSRMPKEFGVAFMKDVEQINKNLLATRPFIEWSTKNVDVVI